MDSFWIDSPAIPASEFDFSESTTPDSPITPTDGFFLATPLEPSYFIPNHTDSFHPYRIDCAVIGDGHSEQLLWLSLPLQVLFRDPFAAKTRVTAAVSVHFGVDELVCTFKFTQNVLAYRKLVVQSCSPRKLIELRAMKSMSKYERHSGERAAITPQSSGTKYPCRFNAAELARHLRLNQYDTLLTIEVEENILCIFQHLCDVDMGKVSWMRSFSTTDREQKVDRLTASISPWYPEFTRDQVETIIRRGIYRATQGRLRKERRRQSRNLRKKSPGSSPTTPPSTIFRPFDAVVGPHH